ncbi:hypothetical protein MTR_2g005255 [Medicago truncatula]|uniref:Uncharacterized protein n=1 Tax=Medicago truncatula TaxID=3880 RepID=A0A072V3M2_MEDTR|nr:hypothetical protein MTR_2g005255 [Medicago truncatula]
MATQTKYNGNTESEHGIMGEKEKLTVEKMLIHQARAAAVARRKENENPNSENGTTKQRERKRKKRLYRNNTNSNSLKTKMMKLVNKLTSSMLIA